MPAKIQIIDCGRGLQLSTSRITVQDLVPYFQEGISSEEIIRWIPTLSVEEIAVAKEYYQEHALELDEQDRRIRERSSQRQDAPEILEILRRGGGRKWRLSRKNSPGRIIRGETVIKLLADVNVQGQVALLASCMQAEPWREFWDHLELQLLTFADVGLDPTDSDVLVWHRCQQFLITDNRNDDGPDSLAATINKANNNSTSLPVFTVGDIRSVVTNAEYRHRVIDRLLRYLLERENIHGTGRLFLP